MGYDLMHYIVANEHNYHLGKDLKLIIFYDFIVALLMYVLSSVFLGILGTERGGSEVQVKRGQVN